eukprot:Seg415.2 transcript_id=Seg415.2/GoldUCD/mRNA.D3Y31 product="putative 28S rRNA" protein_id=Seg415.2/GoldUCD/D3Y31
MEKLYNEAVRIIELAKEKKGNIKGLCFNSEHKNTKKLYALVCQTIKYKKITSKLLERLNVEETDNEISPTLQLILVYDLLFGRGVRCGGKIGKFARTNKKRLLELLTEFQESKEDMKDADTTTVSLPRYVRVNSLKTSVEEVVTNFEIDGWRFITEKEGDLTEEEFSQDKNIPDILIFSPGTDLHEHPLYKSGHILLQDKASCLPAFLLKPKQTSTVIDACAAPGNKTTHLSAIMNNQGNIFAFDLDPKRLKLMKQQLEVAGTDNVEALHQDFLKASPEDSRFKKVKYILLDPTCSGSGMVSRMDQLLDDDNSSDRLQKRLEALSKFQYAMLCHALSFPKVKKVAYSTCSVHQQENETVIERALLRFKETFSLVNLLPSWENRGLPVFEQGPYCLRASPEKDRTNGFFVAVFKRIKGKKPREEHGTENEKPLTTSEETIHHKSKKRKLADNEVNLETFDPSNRAETQQPQEERKLQNGAKRRKKKSKDDKKLKNEGHANIIIDSKKRQKKNSKRRKRTLKTSVTA